MCSTKWATPLVSSFSYLLPASIQRPTVAVAAPVSSVATRIPLSKVVNCVGGWFINTSFNEAAVDLHLFAFCQQNSITQLVAIFKSSYEVKTNNNRYLFTFERKF